MPPMAAIRDRRRQDLSSLEVVHDAQERRRRDDVARAGPGRLAAARRGTDHAALASRGRDRGRKYAGDPPQRTVEGEFAERQEGVQLIRREDADRRHQRERDRQVVVTALLVQIGGREIDGDAPRRQRETDGRQGRSDALATLRRRLCREARRPIPRSRRRDGSAHRRR